MLSSVLNIKKHAPTLLLEHLPGYLQLLERLLASSNSGGTLHICHGLVANMCAECQIWTGGLLDRFSVAAP